MADMDPALIERALAEDRAELARSLERLRDRLAPASLLADGKAALKAQAQPILAKVDEAVSARPLTAAVVGIALAALLLGRRQERAGDAAASSLAGTRFEALTRWEDEGGPAFPPLAGDDDDWLDEAVGLKDRAAGLLSWIDEAARRRLVPAADLAVLRADVVAALARDTARALGRGLESVTGAARERAIGLREQAYLRQLALGTRLGATVRERPLGSALGIAAAGAATALLFPPTETEDRLLGEARDSLVDDLSQAVRGEVSEASAFLRTLGSALRTDLAQSGILSAPGSEPQAQANWQH